jgi:hypothetical protein
VYDEWKRICSQKVAVYFKVPHHYIRKWLKNNTKNPSQNIRLPRQNPKGSLPNLNQRCTQPITTFSIEETMMVQKDNSGGEGGKGCEREEEE